MSAIPTAQAAQKASRTLVRWMLRAAVSALVRAVLFSIVPIEQVWSDARRLPSLLWLFALGPFLLGHCAAAAKWRLLIGPGTGIAASRQTPSGAC